MRFELRQNMAALAIIMVMSMCSLSSVVTASPGASSTAAAFVTPVSSSSLKVKHNRRQFLFVDGGANGEFSNSNVVFKKNEWGIVDSTTLPPLGPTDTHGKAIPRNELPNGGRVTLVGSGPGDPDLLTVSAYKLLQDPNAVVICDRLVSEEIRALVQGELKVARKFPGCQELAQEEIFSWVHQGLQDGKHVIRLKIGDPFVFGRGGEEVLTFRKFGVESKVIPGVSSAFSAPLLGSIPVTHRGVANQVVMCTGYGRGNSSPDLIQYHKEQTAVFLMAVGRLDTLTHRLVTLAGYPKDTPVAVVEKAGCPTQRTVVGDMETIAGIVKEHDIQAPSTIIVGEVVHVLLQLNEKGERVQGLIQNMAEQSVSA